MSQAKLSPQPLQEIFLPVHGAVYLFPEEMAVFDHPAFQRLKRMRQLGLAHHVFPGANHTRFEHSLGALHVAQVMIDSVNRNYARRQHESGDLKIQRIGYTTARFIRLAALLHDLGHLPLGHTFEDELGHLPKHDDRVRLCDVASIRYPHYVLRRSKYVPTGEWEKVPEQGGNYTLGELIDTLYAPLAERFGAGFRPFDIFTAIVCKPRKADDAPAEGKVPDDPMPKADDVAEFEHKLSLCLKLSVCRDIVGNTICADLLDYLVRDWFHIGKSFQLDERIFQLMEVRNRDGAPDGDAKFVINGGGGEKIYHDAFTNVLDLLESRYKLTETVIFNRTKVSLNAILDRCLLEVRDIWTRAGLSEAEFQKQAVSDLIKASDDAVPNLLQRWARGGGERKHREAVTRLRERDRAALGAASGRQMSLLDGPVDETLDQFSAVEALIERLRERQNYKLVFKLSRAQFAGLDGRHEAFIALYKATANRRSYLRGVESLCRLPEGSLVSYFAPTRAMNAKVADVNVLLDGKVVAFAKHETDNRHEPARQLTSGTLTAQVERFKHLWSFQVFMERGVYDGLTDLQRGALNDLLQGFLFNMDGKPRNEFLVRRSLQAFVEPFQMQEIQAARLNTPYQPPPAVLGGFVFPSGVPYDGGA